jgi:hypothetical protein
MLFFTLNKNMVFAEWMLNTQKSVTEVEIGKIDGHQKRIAAKVVVFHSTIQPNQESELKNNAKRKKDVIRFLGRSNETVAYS